MSGALLGAFPSHLPNNTVVSYLAQQCPSLDVAWQGSWSYSCFTEGAIACINSLALSTLFMSCKDGALQNIERDLSGLLRNRAISSKKVSLMPDCLSDDCADIDRSTVHPREEKAAKLVHARETASNWVKSLITPREWIDVQEFLRFRKDDPREKLLYLSAEYDYNDALDPSYVSGILTKLSQKYDIKYNVVSSPKELCQAIERTKHAGKLANVVIEAHGNPEVIGIGKNSETSPYDRLSKSENYAQCFSGIHPSGKIILFSCSTGGKGKHTRNPLDNIAQKVADSAQRTVIAPTCYIYPSKIEIQSIDPILLHHPQHSAFNNWWKGCSGKDKNIFKVFEPKKQK